MRKRSARINPLAIVVCVVAILGLAALLFPKSDPSGAPSSASMPHSASTTSSVTDEQRPMRHFLESTLSKGERISRRHHRGTVSWKTVEPGVHIKTADGGIVLKPELADPPLRNLTSLRTPLAPYVGRAEGQYDEVWTAGPNPKYPDSEYEEVYWLKKRMVVYFLISPRTMTRDGHRSLIGDRKWLYQDIIWSY